MVLTGGGGGVPRKKKSLPVRILGGAGALAGGALGALGTLTGRHRSAGSLLQGAVSGAATGSALGRGLGEKTGGAVGATVSAPFRGASALRNRVRVEPPSRLTPPDKSGGKHNPNATQIDADADADAGTRNTDASAVSDSM